ncbi:MAG: GntR family transcriptional regulator [Clostridia bacterium]|nr:GntR family transcriptional regulator [Clostridia bacterium]
MINLDYKDGRSLHEQIEKGLRELIINKVLVQDEQLPSVRELSISLTVNPNTVQRAYKQLEQDGFIYSVKGKGNFVAPVSDVASTKRIEELYSTLMLAAKELCFLGEDSKTLQNVIKNIYSEKEDSL